MIYDEAVVTDILPWFKSHDRYDETIAFLNNNKNMVQ